MQTCLAAGGTIIGLGTGAPFEEEEVQLRAGDRLFLYTDGITELANAAGDLYGEERLYEALAEARGVSLEDACDRVIQSMSRFGDGRLPQDDVTLLAIEFAGPQAEDRQK